MLMLSIYLTVFIFTKISFLLSFFPLCIPFDLLIEAQTPPSLSLFMSCTVYRLVTTLTTSQPLNFSDSSRRGLSKFSSLLITCNFFTSLNEIYTHLLSEYHLLVGLCYQIDCRILIWAESFCE